MSPKWLFSIPLFITHCLKRLIFTPAPTSGMKKGSSGYGFHGISFQYCSKEAASFRNTELNGLKDGDLPFGIRRFSLRIQEGKSIDTTMGFTPLEGLMMDTRCGSIDPGIALHLLEKKRKAQTLFLMNYTRNLGC